MGRTRRRRGPTRSRRRRRSLRARRSDRGAKRPLCAYWQIGVTVSMAVAPLEKSRVTVTEPAAHANATAVGWSGAVPLPGTFATDARVVPTVATCGGATEKVWIERMPRISDTSARVTEIVCEPGPLFTYSSCPEKARSAPLRSTDEVIGTKLTCVCTGGPESA